MPARSKVAMLPDEVRTQLERRILERSFSGYQELADWLQAQGYRIAHDSVQRHGVRLARKIEAMEQLTYEAQALAAATNHASGSAAEVAIELIHQRILALLVQEPERSDESNGTGAPASASDSACAPGLTLPDLARMTRILADLNRITMARQRQADANSSQRSEPTRSLRAQRAETASKGLSEEAYQAIRNALLGIDPFDPGHREDSSGASVSDRAPGRLVADEGSNDAEGDACALQEEQSSCTAAAPSAPKPLTQANERVQTQLDADSRSSAPKSVSVAPSSGWHRVLGRDGTRLFGRFFIETLKRTFVTVDTASLPAPVG